MSSAQPESSQRRSIGIWVEAPARWTNEGITRLLGFLIEGVAVGGEYTFRILLADRVRDDAEKDLRSLNAQICRDFTLHSPRDLGISAHSFPELAAFANEHVAVEAWLTLFPDFSYASLLDAPVTVIFPDAIPKVFPEFGESAWGLEGAHLRWERNVQQLLEHAAGAITFSEHVARDHVEKHFSFPREKISVVPHAAPDLARYLTDSGEDHDRYALGELLRSESASRGWEYLETFPFEQVPYIALSTQDRVTKNIQLAARSLQILLRERRKNLKILMTAPLHYHQGWTVLPNVVEQTLSQFDIVSMPDLSREAHAALLRCAAITVHPSIFEGGHAPFPFYEAISVGTPCIIAKGPHVTELAAQEPALLQYCFDPNDADGLADLVLDILSRRDDAIADQRRLYSRLKATDWSFVAAAYASAALAAPEKAAVK